SSFYQKDPYPACLIYVIIAVAAAPAQTATALARRQPPLQSALSPLLATGLAVGDSPLWVPCSRPPLQASRCKRVCPQAATAPSSLPQLTVPAGTAPEGCCPCERRQSPPCRGPWARPGRGWPAQHGG
ncbi:hypothetical protein B296_00028290, partial [Ensete ventricosum]